MIVIALMTMLLMMTLGLPLVLITSTELRIAAHYANGQEALYAAEAALARALEDLPAVSDWDSVLAGTATSAFTDGAPTGLRQLPDGSALNLTAATNMANCGKPTSCSSADIQEVTADRPWGSDNPDWRLYAHAPLNQLLAAGRVNANMYVIVWVGDDPSENDGDPLRDGSAEANPGSGIISLRAEAFGSGGAHKVLLATVSRAARESGPASIRILSWKEIR
jgi:hypothetical protein